MNEPTPTERARDARNLLIRNSGWASAHPEDREAIITDLMTDLLHLAQEEGMNPESRQRSAWHHFQAEQYAATRVTIVNPDTKAVVGHGVRVETPDYAGKQPEGTVWVAFVGSTNPCSYPSDWVIPVEEGTVI